MKHVLTIVAGLLLGLSAQGQQLRGRWYMINRSGLIETTIGADSVRFRELFLDMTPKSKDRSWATPYVQQLNLPDRSLLVLRHPHGYAALTYFAVQPGRQLRLAWNVPDTVVATLDGLLALHRQPGPSLLGDVLYHADTLAALRAQPAVETMPLPAFRELVRSLRELIVATAPQARRRRGAYAFATHNNQLATQAVAAIGYNPLVYHIAFDALFLKYQDDPAVQSLLNPR